MQARAPTPEEDIPLTDMRRVHAPLATLRAQIDGYLAQLVAQHRFSGSVLVADHGEVILSNGYGDAQHEAGLPNTAATPFRLASLTKPLTAMAVLLLVEEGLIALDNPIGRFLPYSPASWQSITIHHLLTHTSGLPEYSTVPALQPLLAQSWSPDALVERFQQLPLDFAPGSRFHYTNSGYVLLGQLIEHVSGLAYGDFLRGHLFHPLGMMQTGYAEVGVPADPVHMTAAYAAGGVYSTVEDLFRWDQAMYAERLLSREAYAAMFAKHALISPTTLYRGGYGYGWYVSEDFHPKTARLIPVAYHGGFVFGYHTQLRRYCREGGRATLIVLSNLETAPITQIVGDIQQMLFGGQSLQ